MGIGDMRRAVFLDRDGVINRLALNPFNNEYESPHSVEDFELYPWTIDSLSRLQQMGYLLFLVSNQPSYAKGKTSMENLHAIQAQLHQLLIQANINFAEYYYCFHHPQSLVPELASTCGCRKPGTLFLQQARDKYRLDLAASWFVGDQDSDIFCGQKAGNRTILVLEKDSAPKRGKSSPDFFAQELREAAEIIIQESMVRYGN
jgi:D-glycero-D-manno-heptose 1,7-bisphosphate phosphatase